MNINKLRMKKGKKGRRAFVPPGSISSYLRAQQQMHEKNSYQKLGMKKSSYHKLGMGKRFKKGCRQLNKSNKH